MMIPFHEFKGIEVSGRAIIALLQAFGQFKPLASKYLREEGVGQEGADGLVHIEATAWYPMEGQLRALARFNQEMGDSVVQQIGAAIPKHVEWPPGIKDARTLATALDLGYHMSYRKDGQVMGDPEVGRIIEGIGHYLSRSRPDGAIEIEVDAPYPCAFDKGLLLGSLRTLGLVGVVRHEDNHPCRKRGGRSCIYVIKG